MHVHVRDSAHSASKQSLSKLLKLLSHTVKEKQSSCSSYLHDTVSLKCTFISTYVRILPRKSIFAELRALPWRLSNYRVDFGFKIASFTHKHTGALTRELPWKRVTRAFPRVTQLLYECRRLILFRGTGCPFLRERTLHQYQYQGWS